MKRSFLNTNGQSLVEVTVALAILAVVLTGVVTLAVNTVGLMISSRMRMEATSLAQQGLEEAKGGRSNECDGLAIGIKENGIKIGEDKEYTRTIKISDAGTAWTGAVLIDVKITWNVKGQPDGNIELKEILNKKL